MTAVLESLETVIAENVTALRGGGGSSHGSIVSATIRAHPSRPVLRHVLCTTPLDAPLSRLLNDTSGNMSTHPAISEEGISVY